MMIRTFIRENFEGEQAMKLQAAVNDAVLGHLTVKVNNRLKTTAGQMLSRREERGAPAIPYAIELNKKLRSCGPDAVHNTFTHELAHAVAGHDAGHGPVWRTAHRQLGGTAARTHNYSAMARTRVEKKVVGICERCGTEVKRRKRLPRGTRFQHNGLGCGGEIRPV